MLSFNEEMCKVYYSQAVLEFGAVLNLEQKNTRIKLSYCIFLLCHHGSETQGE